MSSSETGKPRRAVLVSIAQENDEYQLRLDDVESQGSELWKTMDHITSKLIPEKAFDELQFDEKELASFGYYILARLHAFKGCGEI